MDSKTRLDSRKLGLNIVRKLSEHRVDYQEAVWALNYALAWVHGLQSNVCSKFPEVDDTDQNIFNDNQIFDNTAWDETIQQQLAPYRFKFLELDNLRTRLDVFEAWWNEIPSKVTALEKQVAELRQIVQSQ